MKKDALVGTMRTAAAFFGGILGFFLHQKKTMKKKEKNLFWTSCSTMLTELHRALATCCVLKQQLEKEQTARKAMTLCIQDIRKKLDRYKGHLINRIRLHIDNHQTEYVRYERYPI